MKILSWNINSLKSIINKYIYKNEKFIDFVNKRNYDIIGFQEVKINVNNLNLFNNTFNNYPYKYVSGTLNTRAGIIVLSKIKPNKITYDLGSKISFFKGRAIDLEFTDFHFICIYQINAGEHLKTLDKRDIWDKHFFDYIKKIKKRVIICGDMNCIGYEKPNAWNFEKIYNKKACATKLELDNFEKLLTLVKNIKPKKFYYTYFSYRFNSRETNRGLRLDYFLVSKEIKGKTKVLDNVYGSDHLPLELQI